MGDIYGNISEYKQLKEFMSGIGLKLHIKEMTTDIRTAIEHIYIDVENMICGVSKTYNSFHNSIWVALLLIVNVGTARVPWYQRNALRKELL